jgi:signal transduction histidine kinase/ligand-binding sensor domain-containing protein/DNA-binding response OmpR family regulator
MRQLFILVFGILLSINSLAQETQYKFRHLTVQEGLSRSWVKCIFQDSIGYLWVGTADGLNRYDGISFKTYHYKSGDTHCIDNNNILVIYEDKKKNLWVGTQTGLNLYDRKKDEFIPLTAIKNYVSCIYEYENGLFLLGSPGGLFLFNPANLTARQIHNEINIEDILHDRNNNIWLATYNGLLLLDTADYSYYHIISDNRSGPSASCLVRSLFQDSKGGIWIGTNTEGLYYMRYDKYNPRNPNFIQFKSDPRNDKTINDGAIYAIAEDEKGYLWVGVENGGINLLNLNSGIDKNVSFRHLVFDPVDQDGLSDNSIHYIYHDRQNTIWIGTYGNGVNYYNAILQKFSHFVHLPGSNSTINNNRVNTIYEDDKNLWIGTEGGLNVLDKQKQVFHYYTYQYNNPKSIGSNAVWAIKRDRRNDMWIGLWNGGLNLFDEKTKTFKRFTYDENNPNSIGSNSMLDILETSDNHLWIATMSGGLNEYNYNTSNFRRYQPDFINLQNNSISSNWIVNLMEADDGHLWISTTVAVDILNRQTNHFTRFTHDPKNPNSISYNGAICIFQDSRKNIWIGTSNGLNLFNPSDSTFKHFYKSNGLPDNIIKAIVEDNQGNLWLSTNNGISEFENAIKVPEKPVFKNYNVNDGLQGNEFNSCSAFKNKEGLIYFGGNNGYNVFNPDKITTNPFPPNIVFTKLLIFNKPVSIADKNSPLVNDISMTKVIKLTHRQSVFTIEFASLNLLASENNKYAFILEGFEKEWNLVGKQHAATYTNLDPGKYTFKVKASNNDGLWNESGTSLDIIILPAWWQTWAAKIIYISLAILAIYFFRKHTIISTNLKNELWREHLEKKKSEELTQLKNQFFTNVSHELRTPLTLILGPLKKLISETENTSPLQTIYRNASRLKTLVDQIMDFSKIESHMMKLNLNHDDIIGQILICSENFTELSRQKNISFQFKSTLSSLLCDFDSDKIEKIFSNILSNAVKNAPEGGFVMIVLDFDKKTSSFIIEISNSGKGIDPSEIDHIFDRFFTSPKQSAEYSGTGIGLDLTRKLVELHKGTVSVTSELEKGTTFLVKLPFTESTPEFDTIEKNLSEPEQFAPSNAVEFKPPVFTHEKRILVIDDNAEMCDFIESILSEQYDVIKENNSCESLNHILNYMPDLIISDVLMPGINGFELVKQVREDLRFSHIPIILLTAKVTVHDHITGYETGADDYIYKPFDGDILKARIKNLIMQKENLRKHFIGTDGIINSKIKANNLDVKFIDDILTLIRNHFSEPEFNVNDIIEKMGMSRSIFYKKFKSLSDQSINDLIRNFRLKKAAELLNSQQYSISQVAYDCGFSDPAYFSKVFKEFYKISPKDFSYGNDGLK